MITRPATPSSIRPGRYAIILPPPPSLEDRVYLPRPDYTQAPIGKHERITLPALKAQS